MRLPKFLLGIVLIGSNLGAASSSPVLMHLRDCSYQEVHAPFPADIVRNSIPEDFKPVAYGDVPVDQAVDVPTSTITCTWKGRPLIEEWSWALVEPPAHLKDRKIDVYGFLIHAFTSEDGAVRRSPRSCVATAFEASHESSMSSMTTGPASEIYYRAVAEDGYVDEVRSWGLTSGSPAANVIRMFGYGSYGRVSSFDALFDSEEAISGNGYYVQRGGEPTASGLTFTAPGYFAGDAIQMPSTNIYVSSNGPVACRTPRP